MGGRSSGSAKSSVQSSPLSLAIERYKSAKSIGGDYAYTVKTIEREMKEDLSMAQDVIGYHKDNLEKAKKNNSPDAEHYQEVYNRVQNNIKNLQGALKIINTDEFKNKVK